MRFTHLFAIPLAALPLAIFAASCSNETTPTTSTGTAGVGGGGGAGGDNEPVHDCAPETNSLPADTGSGQRFEYCLLRKGNVSVVIFDAEGHVVRELLHGAPRDYGWHSEIWDGLDDSGKPAPPGKYTWKLLRTPGFQAEYLFSVGSNYPYGKHSWELAPGTHESAYGVARDADGLYVGARITENIENFLIKLSPDGKTRLWSAMHADPFKGATAIGAGATELFVLTNNAKVLVYDKSNGDLVRQFATGDGASDIAAQGTEMVVAFPTTGVARFYDAKGTTLKNVSIAGVRSVTMDQNGTVWAATGTSVVRFTKANSTPVAVVSGLTNVTRINVDSKGTTLFVAEGAPSQVVKRFSAADGTLQKTFGREGGRLDGPYGDAERHDFRDVKEIIADEEGGFWVSEPEAAPRRLARFNANGDPIHELQGGQAWASWVAPEPGDPKHVWLESDARHLMRLELDYETKAYKVVATYSQVGLANGLIGEWGNAALVEARIHDGETYLIHLQSRSVVRVDEANRRLVGVAVARRYQYFDKDKEPDWLNAWAPADAKAYTWADKDGDGIPQQNEVQFFNYYAHWLGLTAVDDAFDFLGAASEGIYAVHVTGWTEAKAPIYEFVQDPITEGNPRITDLLEPRWASYLTRDPKTNAIYGAFNDKMPDFGKSSDSFFSKWSGDGKLLWSVGHTLGETTAYAPPGAIGAFRRIAGRIGDAVVMTDFHEGPRPGTTYVWSTEGLWAGGILDQPDVSNVPPWYYGLGAETLSSRLVPSLDGDANEALFFGTQLNETRVYRVRGFDKWENYSGELAVAIAPVEAQGSGPRVDFFAEDTFTTALGTRQAASLSAASLPSTEGGAARWYAEIAPPASGGYTLHVTSSGRVRAVLDGTTVVNAWKGAASSPTTDIPVTLNASKRALLVIETAGAGGVGDLVVEWTPPGGARSAIPTSALYPHLPRTLVPYAHGPGLKMEYFKGASFDEAQKVYEELRPSVDEDYGSEKDGLQFPHDLTGSFSVRASGVFVPQYTGLYSFWNDLAGTSVYVDERHVGAGSFRDRYESETIQLEAGKPYPIRIEFSSEKIHPSVHRGFALRVATPPGTWPRTPGSPPGAQLLPSAEGL